MKTTLCMIYKEVIEKRLARKREQLATWNTSSTVKVCQPLLKSENS